MGTSERGPHFLFPRTVACFSCMRYNQASVQDADHYIASWSLKRMTLIISDPGHLGYFSQNKIHDKNPGC